MSCLSWNCRGLGYPRAIPFLSDLLRDCKPDFFFLLETFSGMTAIEGIKNKLQYSGCFVVSNVGHRGGLVVYGRMRGLQLFWAPIIGLLIWWLNLRVRSLIECLVFMALLIDKEEHSLGRFSETWQADLSCLG